VDEFEALRLVEYEGLYQEGAAERMGVSRQTFGRIIEAGRRKVAQALVEGLALRIEGGKVEMAEMRTFNCAECGHSWQLPHGRGRPTECPQCQNKNIHRAEEERGAGCGAGKGRQRRRRCGRVQA
jgi:rubrerythrin